MKREGRERQGKGERDRQREKNEERERERQRDRETDCLFGFITSSSTTRLSRGRAPRLTSDNFTCYHT